MKIEKQWENNRSKMISYIVFGAYLFLLTWLVLFKFAFTIEEIPHLRQLNLIPFHYETSVAFITHMKEEMCIRDRCYLITAVFNCQCFLYISCNSEYSEN